MRVIMLFMFQQLVLILFVFDMVLTHLENFN